MKAITLWEPYATLITIGAKKYETRHWSTSYRGDLVIHSAKKRDREILDTYEALRPEMLSVCQQLGITMQPTRFGFALCVVRLVDCHPAETIPDDERHFGNFGYGRFAWELADVRPFDPPIQCSGAQGLWNWRR